MTSSLDIDRSKWPIIVYRIEGEATAEMTQQYVDAVRENIERAEASGERYVSIVISDNLATNAAHRKAIASSIEDSSQRIAKVCLGNALVTNSRSTRGLLTALKWVINMPVEIQVFANLESAMSWAEHLLRAPSDQA